MPKKKKKKKEKRKRKLNKKKMLQEISEEIIIKEKNFCLEIKAMGWYLILWKLSCLDPSCFNAQLSRWFN